MKRKQLGVIAFIVLFAVLLGTDISGGDELIEPTRKLGRDGKQWGGLSLFSEPPQMDVYVDGKKVGRTPVWLRQVEAAKHVLQIGEVETSVQVKKGKTVKIGLFKGALVKLAEVDQHSALSESKKKRESQRPSQQQQSKKQKKEKLTQKQKKEDLSLWERYINGSLKHF